MERAAQTAPAVVVNVSNAVGVGVIWNLAAEGVPVLALDNDPHAPGLLSRHAAHGVCPDPHYDERGFIEALVEIGRRLPRKGVLLPCQDDCVFAASRNAALLEPYYLLPFSRWESMRVLAEKVEQIAAARRAGVGVPTTAFIRTEGDLMPAAEQVPFPAVLKSSDHLAMRRRKLGKVVRVEQPQELPAAYERVKECGVVMLQEVIPGDDDCLFTLHSYLDAQGRPLAQVIRRKLRQHPRTFGECRFGTSLWVQDVADHSYALLREVGFQGVSGVEFKRDPRDGGLKFMEVNVRHEIWHRLASAVGVNLSYVAYRDALGSPVKAPPPVDGPRWILSSYDVPDSVREIVRGELSAREWLGSLKGTKVDGMLSLSDPVPGVYEVGRRAWRSAARRVRPS
jgi:predicted ATP-grasp superfamily ATP-dependent carboligase